MIRFFDGGMGSMLNLAAGELPEKLNISEPERVFAVHKGYADAGAQFITANTFGANSLKYDNVDQPREQHGVQPPVSAHIAPQPVQIVVFSCNAL